VKEVDWTMVGELSRISLRLFILLRMKCLLIRILDYTSGFRVSDFGDPFHEGIRLGNGKRVWKFEIDFFYCC